MVKIKFLEDYSKNIDNHIMRSMIIFFCMSLVFMQILVSAYFSTTHAVIISFNYFGEYFVELAVFNIVFFYALFNLILALDKYKVKSK